MPLGVGTWRSRQILDGRKIDVTFAASGSGVESAFGNDPEGTLDGCGAYAGLHLKFCMVFFQLQTTDVSVWIASRDSYRKSEVLGKLQCTEWHYLQLHRSF